MEINAYGEVHIHTKEKEELNIKGNAEMALLKRSIKMRDENCCQCCGEKDKPLEVHHIFPQSKYPTLVGDSSNLITLCQSCHHKYHDKFEGVEGAVSFAKFIKEYPK